MLQAQSFYATLTAHGTDFFTGVPDSLLKNFCAYLTDTVPSEQHIIAANEGNAVGLAVGHYMATGNIPLIYMQNSGLGNTVNPLLSLADAEVYGIPLLLVIGWRGEPGFHDEPQHVKQGKCTASLLDAMHIPYVILSEDSQKANQQIAYAYQTMEKTQAPFACIVRKDIFEPYTLVHNNNVKGNMTREQAIEQIILAAKKDSVFVSTTGMASRELFELREKHAMSHASDFLTVGGMGHASQIALGIALQKKNATVYCLDGDGAALMHLGGMAIIGSRKPANFVHIVLNNGAHDSVGGQPTVGRDIDLCALAHACGYEQIVSVETPAELSAALKKIEKGLYFIQVLITKGARKDLGRPTTPAMENKENFMQQLEVL